MTKEHANEMARLLAQLSAESERVKEMEVKLEDAFAEKEGERIRIANQRADLPAESSLFLLPAVLREHSAAKQHLFSQMSSEREKVRDLEVQLGKASSEVEGRIGIVGLHVLAPRCAS